MSARAVTARIAATVPTLVYHRIDDEEGVPPAAFERQMSYLRRKGFHTATLDELIDHAEAGRSLPPRSVALTFDDATADHWSRVFPVLERHGLRATFFVPTALPGEGEVRPQLEDVRSGRAAPPEMPLRGSLSGSMRWSELAAAARSGLVAIESHGHFHARHAAGPRVVGFVDPGDGVPTEDWGRPVYESASTLASPRFDPPPEEAEAIRDAVASRGGAGFFRKPNWRDELGRVLQDHRARRATAWRGESPAEFLARVEDELRMSLDAIGTRLDRRARFLAWPHGEAAAGVHAVARRLGFEATFLSSERSAGSEAEIPKRMLPRHHFGEDYAGPLRVSVHYWRFVRTLEATCGFGMRRHLSAALRPLIRAGARRSEGIPWRG